VRLLAATPHGTYDVPGASRWRNRTGIFPANFRKIEAGNGKPAEVRLTFRQGLVFRGQVLDPDGKPLAGAAVRVARKGYQYPEKEKAATDADGPFEVAVVKAPDAYLLDIFSAERKSGASLQKVVEKGNGLTQVVVLDQLKLVATGIGRGHGLSGGQPLVGY